MSSQANPFVVLLKSFRKTRPSQLLRKCGVGLYQLSFSHNFIKDASEKAISHLDNDFIDAASLNSIYITNLLVLATLSPNTIIRRSLYLLQEKATITSMLSNLDLIKLNDIEDISLSQKMAIIACFWETYPFFRFAAECIADTEFNGNSSPNQVYKHFKALGLSTQIRRQINKIRNCANHRYFISDGRLINKDQEEVCHLNDLDNIVKIIRKMWEWRIKSTFYALIYLPSYLTIFGLSVFTEFTENKEDYLDWWRLLEGTFTSIINIGKVETTKRVGRSLSYTVIWFFESLYLKSSLRKAYLEKYDSDKEVSFRKFQFVFHRLRRVLKEIDTRIVNLQDKIEYEPIEYRLATYSDKIRSIHKSTSFANRQMLFEAYIEFRRMAS